MLNAVLPQGFTYRPPAQEDLPAIADLLIAHEIVDEGQARHTQASMIDWLQSVWKSPTLELEHDAWIVLAPGGQCVGYVTVWQADNVPEELYATPRVHPDYRGLGIGTFLLQQAEARARKLTQKIPAEKRVTLNSWANGTNQAAQQLLERAGFTVLRYYWRMEIELEQPPPPPTWPAGITVRTFIPGQDERAVFEATDEAFRDSWEYMPWDFDEWVRWEIERDYFDPSLWFLALDKDQIAGCALCNIQSTGAGNIGWVGDLSVRRPWRKRGIGLALLHHAFGQFYQRGLRHCGLSVDSQNVAGATRLYERAGMHKAPHYNIRYEKELRPQLV